MVKMQFTLVILIISILLKTNLSTTPEELIQIACKRNPKLHFCKKDEASHASNNEGKTLKKKSSSLSRAINQLANSQEPHFRIFGEKLKELKNNPFKDDVVPISDSSFDLEPENTSPDTRSGLRLGGKEDEERFSALMKERKTSGENGEVGAEIDHTGHVHKPEDAGFFIPEAGPAAPSLPDAEETEKGLEVYCKRYEENYVYYCRTKNIEQSTVQSTLYKFCPSYEANCPEKAQEYHASTPTHATPKELEVFEKLTHATGPGIEKFDPERERLLKMYPCTPNCDVRIHKHCTVECKCDYIYPVVQKFCNPPPVPFFLNTCKIWYHGCPKYLQYFYSSQYIHSKAEKGKVWNGPMMMQPQTQAPVEEMPILPDPFDVEHNHPMVERGSKTFEGRKILNQKLQEKKALDDPFNSIETRGSEKFKPITRSRTSKAKAFQVPAVAGDSFQGNDFHRYDPLTDIHGISHEKHSRSPFSKPGLWTANPDNPHNRDHANKYWYHPQSVQADWLNGQVAWGAHWAVPAFGVGGTDGFSTVHFPSIGNFFDIPDDYD
uniref:Conserved secreted protein n=1 Tax=Strongyloides papillosus TaxID=174720 RepID=A0A0N5B6K1_STREA